MLRGYISEQLLLRDAYTVSGGFGFSMDLLLCVVCSSGRFFG